MHSKSIPEPWQSFLSDIDATLSEAVELHCLGGFVITVLYDLARPTADVDVIAITPRSEIESLMSLAGQGSELHRKHKLYLQLVGVATVPDRYEERLTEINEIPRCVKLEQKGFAPLKGFEGCCRGGSPEIDLIHRFLRSVELKPIVVSDADVKLHLRFSGVS